MSEARRAVEVRASYGDALICSRHLGAAGAAPAAGAWLRLGIGLVIVGVLLAVAEVLLVGTYLWMPVDGAIAGLVAVMVGFGIASAAWHRRAEPDHACFRIGESPKCDVTTAIPDLPSEDELPIVALRDGRFELSLLPSMHGWVGLPEDPRSFDTLRGEGEATPGPDGRVRVPLGTGAHAHVECGELGLDVSPADAIPRPRRAAIFDLRLLLATGLAALLVGGTIYLAGHFVPPSRTMPDLEDAPVVYDR